LGRRAVAATLVSFLVFTTMLLANSALYSAESSSLGAAVLSTTQIREHQYGQILVGLSDYDALATVQSYLRSNSLDCNSAQEYLDSLAGSQRGSGADEGIGYTTAASWSYAGVTAAGAGTAFLSQFGGYVTGALNLEVMASVQENFDGALPSYSSEGTQVVHLPVPLDATISLCLAALSDLGGALSALPYCNSTAVDSAIDQVRSGHPSLDSFTLTATASPLAAGCEIEYLVTTTLTGLEGVSGTFPWTVSAAGWFVT
jgi:hypothetical protein